ncbi:MAG: hypothetical protein AAF902_02965 [Chloroflexota bacterium]
MQQKSITVRFPADIEPKLSIAAAHEGLNRSELIRKLVIAFVEDHPMVKLGEAYQKKLEAQKNSPQ